MARFWALVGLSLVMAGCGDEPPAQAPLPQPVKLYTVNGDGAGQLRHYPGRVVATEGSQLAFRVSGQLVKLPVRAGEQVKKGQLLAVGDAAGVLHVMELPRSLRRAVNGEKDRMEGFLQRETDRVKDVDGRLEGRETQIEELERRLAEEEAEAARRKKEEEAAAAAEEKKKKSSRKTLTEEDKAEEEFDKMERKFLIKLGLVEPNEDELEEGA